MKTFQDFLHIMDFIENQTAQGPNESFIAASKGFTCLQAQTCCTTHENESNWFLCVKQGSLDFHTKNCLTERFSEEPEMALQWHRCKTPHWEPFFLRVHVLEHFHFSIWRHHIHVWGWLG